MEETFVENHRIPFQRTCQGRELNQMELMCLEKQNSRLVVPHMAQKLEADAKKHWDLFYKRNKTKFFKDRHWTYAEFKELLENCKHLDGQSLLEVGCGVGNLVFPLIQEGTLLYIYACDFSKRAIDFVKENPLYDTSKLTAFVADITSSNFCDSLPGVKVNIVTLVFVLSALHPNKFSTCLENIYNCMQPDAVVLLRDYAVNDMTQIRFKPGHKIDENFYMRQDGTRTYFFTVEKVRTIFECAGFQEVDCCYVHCKTVNKKEGVDAPRMFVQAKFIKREKLIS